MNSATFPLRANERRSTDFLSGVYASARASARFLGSLIRMPAPGVPEASAELLRLAETYDATQPSYASDLRAAATMAERDEDTLVR